MKASFLIQLFVNKADLNSAITDQKTVIIEKNVCKIALTSLLMIKKFQFTFISSNCFLKVFFTHTHWSELQELACQVDFSSDHGSIYDSWHL